MLHGWPSSFVQMLPLVPRLTDSERHGGGHDDAFKVVAMSLPGDGFSDRPSTRGWDVARIADAAADVMTQLGYDRFAVRGSDLGAGVLQQLALRNLRRLVALHLSGTNPYLGWVSRRSQEAEEQFVAAAQARNADEMAYAQQHSSRPQTLAYGLSDSPAGLAASRRPSMSGSSSRGRSNAASSSGSSRLGVPTPTGPASRRPWRTPLAANAPTSGVTAERPAGPTRSASPVSRAVPSEDAGGTARDGPASLRPGRSQAGSYRSRGRSR